MIKILNRVMTVPVIIVLLGLCAHGSGSEFFEGNCTDCGLPSHKCLTIHKVCDTWNPGPGIAPNPEPPIEVVLQYITYDKQCYTVPVLHVSPPMDATIANVKGYQVKMQHFDEGHGSDPDCMILDLRDANLNNRSYTEELTFTLQCFKKLTSGIPLQIIVTQYPHRQHPPLESEVHFVTPQLEPDDTGLFCRKVNRTSTTEPPTPELPTSPKALSTTERHHAKDISVLQWMKSNIPLLAVSALCVSMVVVLLVAVVKARRYRQSTKNGYRRESLDNDYDDNMSNDVTNDAINQINANHLQLASLPTSGVEQSSPPDSGPVRHTNASASAVCNCVSCQPGSASQHVLIGCATEC